MLILSIYLKLTFVRYFSQNTKFSSVVFPTTAARPNFPNDLLLITRIMLGALIHYVTLLITMLVRLSYAIYFGSSFVPVCFPISL